MSGKQKYSLKQLGVDLAGVDKKIVNVLEDHEARLQALEAPLSDVKRLLKRIDAISDPEKRRRAWGAFAVVCDALGIEDLEEP